MTAVLYLAHRLPYPPNKGDKIRSYHLLKHLASQYQVFLGTFIDDPHDWQYVEQIKPLCTELFIRPINPLLAKCKALTGLITGQPLTLPYYTDNKMKHWVKTVMANQGINNVLVFSSAMGQFVDLDSPAAVNKVVDFVDVDSDKWRQYSDKKSGLSAWVYRREAEQLQAYEKKLASSATASLFVSEEEANLFKQLAANQTEQIYAMRNGVDLNYFNPQADFNSTEHLSGSARIVFTGAMDYWANVEAVSWFAKEVLPLLTQVQPDVHFYIVGGNPTSEVQQLASPHVTVTGRVEDVRPYIAAADLVVAPLRIARGIQNKVLEAMAMAKWVVGTEQAMEGINPPDEIADTLPATPQLMAETILARLNSTERQTSHQAARQWVAQRFSWESSLQQLNQWFGSP
ncbi:TIGR03087 family PEP-CTERM/XrtA system glycosyltransferase [Spartinivicinus ruber]|uniref:TIGR03087 family PEP-CTERM/XrtA system glycosyltransferase n=1 Tax=Spartinivicinus ruber TaxID=2683272 RepID=UPI0013D34B4B|nr:TIGR03087 family PEP-CTERM/XrtA system glycosyltransferase [Spartinivicinus ruber]